MKKIVALSLIALSIASLCSCTKRNGNTFFECDLTTTEDESKSTFRLIVKKISYDDYISAEGVNVVEDIEQKSNSKYFLISLTKTTSDLISSNLGFYNLEIETPNNIKTLTIYKDDNDNTIVALTKNDGYVVGYESLQLDFRREL